MVNDGDMTIDATNSTMTNDDGSDQYGTIAIEILYPDDDTLVSDGTVDPGGDSDVYPDDFLYLGIEDVESGRYTLYYFVGPGYPPPTDTTGTYQIIVSCDTNEPTTYPTHDPTQLPTKAPTEDPTTSEPTNAPTEIPTKAPSEVPTNAPTEVPTSAPTTSEPTTSPTADPTEIPTEDPTTPAPTQPDSIVANQKVSGDYNDAAVVITLVLTDECDAVLDASSSTFSGVTMTVTDSSGSTVASGSSIVMVSTLSAGTYTITLTGSSSFVASDDQFGFVCLCKITAQSFGSNSGSDSDDSDSD